MKRFSLGLVIFCLLSMPLWAAEDVDASLRLTGGYWQLDEQQWDEVDKPRMLTLQADIAPLANLAITFGLRAGECEDGGSSVTVADVETFGQLNLDYKEVFCGIKTMQSLADDRLVLWTGGGVCWLDAELENKTIIRHHNTGTEINNSFTEDDDDFGPWFALGMDVYLNDHFFLTAEAGSKSVEFKSQNYDATLDGTYWAAGLGYRF